MCQCQPLSLRSNLSELVSLNETFCWHCPLTRLCSFSSFPQIDKLSLVWPWLDFAGNNGGSTTTTNLLRKLTPYIEHDIQEPKMPIAFVLILRA